MKSLISLVLSGVLLVSGSEAIANPRKLPMCDYPVEEPSVFTKQFFYPKFGISMELPQNLVSMLRVDGSIEILDRGTYKVFQCPPDRRLGRGYYSLIIDWARADIQYDREFYLKDGVKLLIKAERLTNMYVYDMVLRIKGEQGQNVDLRISEDSLITNENFKEMVEEYRELGSKVIIYGGSDR